jgi:hypothetical protein
MHMGAINVPFKFVKTAHLYKARVYELFWCTLG